MLFLTFDLEIHDPIKNLDSKKQEKYFSEEESILKKIFSKINNHNIKISCFVTNDFIDIYNDFFHKYIVKYHEIGSHTATHIFYKKNNINEFVKNIKNNKLKLERELGKKCFGFRAPGGIVPKNLVSILKKNDFKYDSSIIPGIIFGRFNFSNCPKEPYYPKYDNIYIPTNKNSGILEFPLLTSKHLKISMNGIFLSFYSRLINIKKFENNYGNIFVHSSDFKKFKLFDKTFFWDKIKLTRSYWIFLDKYIKNYKNSDVSIISSINKKQ
jgi:peptidoglycan/xylan/chitin deacetylase (PgdA/CDA1 family)